MRVFLSVATSSAITLTQRQLGHRRDHERGRACIGVVPHYNDALNVEVAAARGVVGVVGDMSDACKVVHW